MAHPLNREIAKLIKDIEIPVPDGSCRRRKGFTHRYARARDLGPFVRKLRKEYGGEVRLHSKPWSVPSLVWRFDSQRYGWPGTSQVQVWLPDGADFFVVSV